jgi:hypothetical protein
MTSNHENSKYILNSITFRTTVTKAHVYYSTFCAKQSFLCTLTLVENTEKIRKVNLIKLFIFMEIKILKSVLAYHILADDS